MTPLDAHIIHVIPNEAGGGAERIVEELYGGFQAAGASVECVYFTGTKGDGGNKTYFGARHDSPENIVQLRRLLKDRLARHGRVILHSHLTHGFYSALFARAFLPVIWVHTEHNTTMRMREIKALRPIERCFYMRCAKVGAISAGVQKALIDVLGLPPAKIALIHNGSRLFAPVARPALDGRPLNIVSVGSLNRRKGFHTFIEALKKADIGPWRYTIVGTGSGEQDLRALASRLGLDNRITFAGYTDPRPHYEAADLQAIPSEWEGFGLVAVEGMSTGLQVIGSDVDGLREVLGEDNSFAYLVGDHMSSSAWAKSLERCVSVLKTNANLSSIEAVEHAALFSLDKMVQGYSNLYIELLAGFRTSC